ncbi:MULTISPECIES: ImmA/IrrE family metallo-endopeptidase [unclassified Streptomyces]|uniref:helix-turn-helix domain-containing protein n=1 Tax=unclassified Streptomyces TaxID=2593676 RepID=UPI00168A6D60|nr:MULTISPECIES: XRE family transcriptional regulator [unclassified Streptomyces]MBD3007899.1 ImmA/IrrE family metallo-endopeptidase [Streptomyces sp. 5-10]
MNETVTDRVRKVMGAASLQQAAFAERVGLTPDKLSKSLSGRRRFTSLDLARIAELGQTTVDWLLTGREPQRPAFAARASGPFSDSDDELALKDLVNRFTTAYDVLDLMGRSRSLPALPRPNADLERYVDQGEELALDALTALSAHGVASVAACETSDLVRALEEHFGIDVAQTDLPQGLDGAAWQTDHFRLVLLARTGVWTRQRFTLAHELGHILARDAQEMRTETHLAPGRQKDHTEIRANVFAANFLMPQAEIHAEVGAESAESGLSDDAFRALVVRFKVSPSALAARLHQLGLVTPDARNRLRGVTTEMCHLLAQRADLHEKRVAAAQARRLPLAPARGLYEGYLAGDTTLRPLAAYFDMDPNALHDALEPEPPAVTVPAADTEKGDLIFQP